jgi:acetyl-CoA carboxylase biotin carboxyl carrier protein
LKSIAELTQNDVERILEIVDRLNDVEIHLEVDGMKLHVRKFSDATLGGPVPPAAPQQVSIAHQPQAALPMGQPARSAPAPAVKPAAAAADAGLLEIRAPMLGRFYTASSPSEPPFVQIGSKVGPDDTVCMLEVMKLYNTIPAGITGTVVEILVETGTMVEEDAVLFRVRPE